MNRQKNTRPPREKKAVDDRHLAEVHAVVLEECRRADSCPSSDELRAYDAGSFTSETRRLCIEEHLRMCLFCQEELSSPNLAREKRARANFRKLWKSLIILFPVDAIRQVPLRIRNLAAHIVFHPSSYVLSSAHHAAAVLGLWASIAGFGLWLTSTNVVPRSRANQVERGDRGTNEFTFGFTLRSTEPTLTPILYRKLALLASFKSETLPPHAMDTHPRTSSLVRRDFAVISIKKLGETAISVATSSNAATEVSVPYTVHRQEIVTLQITGHMPPASRIYPLLRADGEPWLVEEGVPVPSPKGGEIKVAVQFGSQDADLSPFDCRFLADSEIVPAERVSDEVLNGPGVLGTSGILRVRRRSTTTPILAITHVNGVDNYGGADLPWVYDEAPVRVTATKLPIDSRIGIVIQPVLPLNERRWVQMDDLTSSGEINGHFGDPMYHRFHRFAISSFLVESLNDFPPRGVPIDAIEWETYRKKFLASSTPVVVIKAGDHFSIDSIGARIPSENTYIPIDTQEDIFGTLDRPLATGERIWVICLPYGDGDAWIATPVSATRDSYWSAKAVRFWNHHSKRFKIVAAISTEDITKRPPHDLRAWVNEVEHSVNTVNAQIRPSRVN